MDLRRINLQQMEDMRWFFIRQHRQGPSQYAIALQDGADEVQDGGKAGGRAVKRFIPFSEGSRDCVGQSLARLNLTTTLAQLFGSFSFRLDASVRAHPAPHVPGELVSLGMIKPSLRGQPALC